MDSLILTNHLGYVDTDRKVALLQSGSAHEVPSFQLISDTGAVLFQGVPKALGAVPHWGTGDYWEMDFSSVTQRGLMMLEVTTDKTVIRSERFEITGRVRDMRLINAAVCYFKASRATGEWDAADRHLCFRDGYREGTVDAHGGWWDASGDVSKHLSHLSHSGWCNPQQTAFCAYTLFSLFELLSCDEQFGILRRRILDEATYGADFLMRMRAPSGSFFRSVSRRESYRPVSDNRAIQHEFRRSSGQFETGFHAPTEGEEQVTDAYYEVSMRSGGGSAIAALAIAARHPYPGTAFHPDEYLAAAKKAFRYLLAHNDEYTNDGQWNFIDTYCALLAAAELWKSSGEIGYLQDARSLADKLLQHMHEVQDTGTWFLREGDEPFFHAADEGLPLLALLTLAETDPDSRQRCSIESAVLHALEHKIGLPGPNPFGYPRYLIREDGDLKSRFFFSHKSPAAPWWQGDNARICSLAAAALKCAGTETAREKREQLKAFAQNILDWVLGRNPFDACMMEGFGRNNIQYSFHGHYDFLALPGGIVNGITSAPDDEDGIFFCRHPGEENGITDNWRWAEQWVPHAAWFLLAMGYLQQLRQDL